jgi:hypothetical protein
MSGTTELLTLLTSVLNVEAVPEDVERKLQGNFVSKLSMFSNVLQQKIFGFIWCVF